MEFKNCIEPLFLLKGSSFNLFKDVDIKHPTLLDIETIGENRYYELFSYMCSTSVDIADILWFENKIWYEDIKNEWEFFIQKCISTSKKISVKMKYEGFDIPVMHNDCIAVSDGFRDAFNFFLNLTGEYIVVESKKADICQKIIYNVKPFYKDNKIIYYTCDSDNFKFTEFFYEKTTEFLNKINWVKRDYEFTKGGTKGAKKYILKNTLYKDRKKKNSKKTIDISSISSSLVARGVCSYNELWSLPIYVVYALYYRLMKIDSYNNTMTALHSGCIDTNKHPIDYEKINWSSIIN